MGLGHEDRHAKARLPGFRPWRRCPHGFLGKDRIVDSADSPGVLRLADATAGNTLATLDGHTGKIWGITVCPDAAAFATVSSDGTVKLWDARLPHRLLAIPVDKGTRPLAFTPDARTLIVADVVGGEWLALPIGGFCEVPANLELRGFDPTRGAEQFHRVLARGQRVLSIGSLSADAALACFAQPGDATTAWEVSTGKRLEGPPAEERVMGRD